MDSIAENILSDLKKEVLKEVTKEKASRFSRIVKNESSAKNYAKAMFDIASDMGKIESIKSDLNVVYSSLLVDSDIYDYYNLPTEEDGKLTLEISQGSDGDYNGNDSKYFVSEDNGNTWNVVN